MLTPESQFLLWGILATQNIRKEILFKVGIGSFRCMYFCILTGHPFIPKGAESLCFETVEFREDDYDWDCSKLFQCMSCIL